MTRWIAKLRRTGLVMLLAGCVVASAALGQAPPPVPVIQLPEKAPAWLDGYRVRWPVRVIGDLTKLKEQSVITRIPTGGWLKPDASDLALQAASGELLPFTVLSHDPAGDTLVQFPRKGNDEWFWIYGVSAAPKPIPKPPALQEGVTVEVRDWAGDDLASWTAVRAGLQKSETVIGNALVTEVIQGANPARPGQSNKFAASYRGFLKIEKDGVYRFFANSDDAAFLFIDGFKVYERPGTNKKLVGQVPINKIGNDVELKAGVHPIEVHQVIGNNPESLGTLSLIWKTPESNTWALVPPQAFVKSLYALPSGIEGAGGAATPCFDYGIDDLLRSGAMNAYLVRFEANGIRDGDQVTWDFGDGTTGTGRSVHHVYFKPGNFKVKLAGPGGLKAFERNIHLWPSPGDASPLSLGTALRSLETDNWRKAERGRLAEMMEFLLICEQPDRWKLIEAVAAQLIPGEMDLTAKANLLVARVDALAELGRATDALALADGSIAEFSRAPSLQATLKLAGATVYHRNLKDFGEASKRYKALLDEHRRLEHPSLRIAAIRWGDLFAESGDLTRAGETYRLAATLGGERFRATAQTEAITRGAMLRIAEQRLRTGDIRQTRQLLEKIELDYPEQKVEGLYCFLRAEADRHGGRYEAALRNYEVLLKLVQWAGFRDRALHGIADTYARMGDESKALDWLASLKDSFPTYFERQKLADYQKEIEGRQERKKAAKPDSTDSPRHLFLSSFEPTEKDLGLLEGLKIAPALGFGGPHVSLIPDYPIYVGESRYSRPLRGLNPTRIYRVEFWVRDAFFIGPHFGYTPHVHAWIVGEGMTYNGNAGNATLYFERPMGRWRKLGFNIAAPPTVDGKLALTIRHIWGVMEIDGLSVRPVSDRDRDALVNFLEGTATP